jgi:hypothetical protein
MPLILAIEPDRRQAAQIKAMVRARLEAELVLAESAEQALAEIGDRVPDLILTSVLLSPKDEVALDQRLRALDGTASYVQTLTIPMLAAPEKPKRARGMLSALRRERPKTMPDGCDPAVFAEQCAEYLERARAERALYAAAAKDREDRKVAAASQVSEAPNDTQARAPVEEVDPTTFILLDSAPKVADHKRFETAWPTYGFEPVEKRVWEPSRDEPLWQTPVDDATENTSSEVEATGESLEPSVLVAVPPPALEEKLIGASELIDPVVEPSPGDDLGTLPSVDLSLATAIDTQPGQVTAWEIPSGEPVASPAELAIGEAVSSAADVEETVSAPEAEPAPVVQRAVPQWLGVRHLWPALDGVPVDDKIGSEEASNDTTDAVPEYASSDFADLQIDVVGIGPLDQPENTVTEAVISLSPATASSHAALPTEEPLVEVLEPTLEAIVASHDGAHGATTDDTRSLEILHVEAFPEQPGQSVERIDDWLEMIVDDIVQPEVSAEAANASEPLQSDVKPAVDDFEPVESAVAILAREDDRRVVADDSTGKDLVAVADEQPVVQAVVEPALTTASDRPAVTLIEQEPEPTEDEWVDLDSEPWAPLRIGIHQLWPALAGGIGVSRPIATIETVEPPRQAIEPVARVSPPTPIFVRPLVPIATPDEVWPPPAVEIAPAAAPIAEREPARVQPAAGTASEAREASEGVVTQVVELAPVVAAAVPVAERPAVVAPMAPEPEPVSAVPPAQTAIFDGSPEPVAAPPVVFTSPTPPELVRPEWLDVIESLKRDVELLQADRVQAPVPVPMPVISAPVQDPVPLSSNVVEASVQTAAPGPIDSRTKKRGSKKKKKKKTSAHDEWGFFDPEEVGFSALLTKLDEVTNSE